VNAPDKGQIGGQIEMLTLLRASSRSEVAERGLEKRTMVYYLTMTRTEQLSVSRTLLTCFIVDSKMAPSWYEIYFTHFNAKIYIDPTHLLYT
jgi:hypothetical protein